MIIIAPKSSANADGIDGWERKREVEVVVLYDLVLVEKEEMGIRTKNRWRKTIMEPEPDDESGLKQVLESLKGLR